MKDKNLFILVLISDFVLFACALFAVLSSVLSFRFMFDIGRMTDAPYFATFTGLSNLFVCIVSLTCLIFRFIRKTTALPLWLFIAKISSVSMISITMLVTLCYLVPSTRENWWQLYINANLFNHLIVPILAISFFILFEKKTDFKFTLLPYSLIPLGLYGIFYLIRAYTHVDASGKIDLYYDIYGFARFGFIVTVLFLLGFMIIAFGVSTGLYFQNKHKGYLN